MADFEIIEADFQQYYHLNVSKVMFRRYVRLLTNLPLESRFVRKYLPSKDWDFGMETQSRILMQLDMISCQLSNIFRKKGAKIRKPAEQFQPDYVKDAKKQAEKDKRSKNKESQKELVDIFKERNKMVKEQ